MYKLNKIIKLEVKHTNLFNKIKSSSFPNAFDHNSTVIHLKKLIDIYYKKTSCSVKTLV